MSYVNAINVMRGAEAVSTYAPVAESEKFRVEYWELEERKLRRRPKPKALAGKIAFVTGGASGIGRATCHALAAQGACVVVADRDREGARQVAKELGGPDAALDVHADVTDEASVRAAVEAACLAFGGLDIVVDNAGLSRAAPLEETTTELWDLQFDVMARGSFLVSRETARVLRAQGHGGDIVYIASKNAVFAGQRRLFLGQGGAGAPGTPARGGTRRERRPGQRRQPRRRRTWLRDLRRRLGAQRAAVYGVAEEDLGRYYAQRTLLKHEVLPGHVAAAVVALVDGSLPLTTGLLVPVDGGVPQAFLR